MTFTIENWRPLRMPLALFGVALAVAFSLYFYASKHKARAQQSLLIQQHAYAQGYERYLTSGIERDYIVKFLPEYRRLEQRGFIGEERRADWVDRLRDIHLHHKLFAIGYDIGIQQEHQSVVLNASPFKLHRSVMTLSIPMLHEGDLLTVLQTLPAENMPPFMLRDCVITRMAEGGKQNAAPNLDTTCALDWLTVTETVKRGIS